MRRSLTAVLLALAAILSCLTPATSGVSATSARRARRVITLERTQCFGVCPMYKLTIFSDGRVNYEGIKYVKKLGKASSRISRSKLNDLIKEFTSISYFDLPDLIEPGQKSCPQVATDMPSAISSLTWQGRYKMVRHYHGCQGLSSLELLTNLENEIDKTVNVNKWTGK